MTPRMLGWMTTAALMAACETQQPPIGCPVQGLDWVATYKPVGESDCLLLPGEQLGIHKFTLPSGEEQLAIKPQMLQDMDATDELDPEHPPYSIGVLPAEADAEGLCTVPSLSVAEKHVPEDPEELLPADAVYRWSNVRLVALPEVPGTQLIADLAYTEDGCTARYEVWAMWPGDIDCADKDTPEEPDDSLCQQSERIPPGFAVTCDPDLLLCVLAKRPPSLQGPPAPEAPSSLP